MRGSLSLGRIAGIEIGIHYTWLLAFVLIAWSLCVVAAWCDDIEGTR